jgi:hypothetical protein
MASQDYALIDERWVEDTLHLRRELGPVTLRQPDPVIAEGQAYGSVLRDADGTWRMYYTRFTTLDPNVDLVGCETPLRYATSSDGLHWTLPALDLVPYRDQRGHNVLIGHHQRDAAGRYLTGYGGLAGWCVLDAVQTPHPAARARYTALYQASPTDTYGGICLATSDDGLRWAAYPENPILPGSQDTQNCLLYDPARQEYVLYQRPTIHCGMDRHANRKLARCTSRDLVHWSPSRVCLDTDEADAPGLAVFDEPGMRGARGRNRQFQGMTPWLHHGCYLALAWLYDAERGTFQLELIHSADGLLWQREALRQPFIADGRPSGFRGLLPVPMGSPPITVGEQHYLYVSNTPYGHHEIAVNEAGSDRALARKLLETEAISCLAVPRDRWIGYTAGDTEGELLSAPLDWAGGKLLLNLAIQPGGRVQVTLQDQWGRPVPDFHLDEIAPLTGPLDATRHHLTFGPGPKTIVKLPPIGPVRLHFRLTRATLYGWTLADPNADPAAAR